jgi:PAS domain S-box-containing protein
MRIKRATDVRPLQIGSLSAEEYLAHLCLLSHDLACIIGLDGRFCFVSPAWELCLGWTAEDLLARPFLDFVHPDDRPATAAEMRGIAGSGGTTGFETRFRGNDGADRRLHWNASFSSQRRVICASARDVTRQERLERELIEAGDREKERLGRELHDGLCQSLAGIAALSATLARKLAGRRDPGAAAAAEITAFLQQAIGDARDLARGLNAGGLAQMGLVAALEVLAANVEALHPVTCAFDCDRHFPRLDRTAEAHLYRIAQEAVSNAVAHGRGNRIGVSLRLRGGQGNLRIRDNGIGIPRGAPTVAGMGLDTMDYRARLIGARLRARRIALRGTMVACTFPLSPPPTKERRHADHLP